MKVKTAKEIIDADITFLEGLQENIENKLDPEAFDLTNLASLEFIDNLKEASNKFDTELVVNPCLESAVVAYFEKFKRPTHIDLDGELYWTPHAIACLNIER